MIMTFTPPDHEFAAASGSNVNVQSDRSYFDHPPNSTRNLTITSNAGDDDPRNFETGETYDISWQGHGGGNMEDATVIRSDYLQPGQGAIVFEGINSNTGEMFQMVWTPGFDLEEWYWSNGGGPSSPNAFWTSDQDAESFSYVCFTGGTNILTPRGNLPVESLRVGDKVATLDNGAQEILWIGKRTVLATGSSSPVVINPGFLSNERPLCLSPQHRVMVSSAQASLHFDQADVWVPAKALVNHRDIFHQSAREVTYYHILLAQHEVLLAENQPTESFFLGDTALGILPKHSITEIARIFPSVGQAPMTATAQSARMMLKCSEAEFLVSAMRAAGASSPMSAGMGHNIAA